MSLYLLAAVYSFYCELKEEDRQRRESHIRKEEKEGEEAEEE